MGGRNSALLAESYHDWWSLAGVDVLVGEAPAEGGTALAGLLAGQDFFTILTGDESIRRRPMGRVVKPLRAMGA